MWLHCIISSIPKAGMSTVTPEKPLLLQENSTIPNISFLMLELDCLFPGLTVLLLTHPGLHNQRTELCHL